MIKFIKGNIFESKAEALVNSVNTVGVMGKGVALQFKERFPENYRLYRKACEEGKVTIGRVFVTSTNSLVNPRWIINFPTKKH
ncbi:macro domain-containing protein [Thermodesulfovibrio sp. 1176]|uniref:macro domain-containing protein n=1 Tax=Thermodesulfovibrio sp. 1176 TaxID=3043424 RepID=UPI0024832617|nr:macro domain-containing protein [Thermodesulfovibrio sp. 1176]MDI1472291.1 macro domain-containing protein [Thermodesulfovibrio sp. 1176]